MLRTLYITTTTICFGLLISLTGCDPLDEDEIASELEFEAELESLAPADLEPEEFLDEEPVSSMFTCESLEESPDDFAAPTGPLGAPPPPPDGGCGSAWIIYGTWQNTSQCGGCYISGMPGRKQIKFDTWMNQCGIQSTVMHERCQTC